MSARLLLAPAEEQSCLKVEGGGAADCTVVEHVRAAFAAAVARMFTNAPAPDLQLVLAVTGADPFEGVAGGLALEIGTRVRILSASGRVLDEVRANGRAVVPPGVALARVIPAAAEDAARVFEERYARSSAVRDWLVASGVAPAPAVSMPERSDRVVSLSFGAALVQGGGDDSIAPGASVRVAGSAGWFVVQLTYSRYTPSFNAVDPGQLGKVAPGSLHVDDFGAEFGAALRIAPWIELRAGPGVHYLSATGGLDVDPSGKSVSSSSKVVPTAFATLFTTFFPFRNGARFFAGVEGRAYFFSTVDMPASSRRVPAANTAFGLIVGAEFPWGARKR